MSGQLQQQPFDVGVVLLLGPPGSGKSLLGRALAKAHPGTVHKFLNVGEELRELGLVDRHQDFPTEASKAHLAAEARRLVLDACRDLQGSVAAAGSGHPGGDGLPKAADQQQAASCR